MLLKRCLPLFAAAALLAAGCGRPPGPSAAENSALKDIPSATQVLSYPIAAKSILSFLPSSATRGLTAPTYLFAVEVKGAKQPTWAVAGQNGAHALHVYNDIADLAAHASSFPLGKKASALQLLAKAPAGKIGLKVVGVRVVTMSSQALGRLGVQEPAGRYTVVSVLGVPPRLHAAKAPAANFVESNGKILTEFGTNR